MSRYIDLDKAIPIAIQAVVDVVGHGISQVDAVRIAERFEDAPTTDVVEVRHGHWISEEEAVQLDRYDLAYTCSVCGRCDWDCTESKNFNFCPNCGAKMDGERREENGV